MEARLLALYRFFTRHWNSFLAAASLIGVAVFSVIPSSDSYVRFFVFLAANAVVWTVIEIKSELTSPRKHSEYFPSMRVARPSILKGIEDRLGGSTRNKPLRLVLLGGRIRSMSDVIRELSDDLRSGRARGHVTIELYCLDPDYIGSRIMPGAVSPPQQEQRNASYASIIRNTSADLLGLNAIQHGNSSLRITVRHYRDDPHIYAYLIGDSVLWWGTYTWSEEKSDFVGPENPCVLVNETDLAFHSLQQWILSWLQLYELDSNARGPAQASTDAADPGPGSP